MDRSFLSDSQVVAASRDFVCARLATYESREEAAVLKSYFIGRSGDLENTTFAILSPTGDAVVRGARSPDHIYADASELAHAMKRIAERYPANRARRALPVLKNVRLGLDVAACDNVPLVAVLGSDARAVARLEEKLASVAWVGSLEGRFVYATTTDAASVPGATSSSGFFVIQPDAYGQKGSVLATIDAGASNDALASALGRARGLYRLLEKDPQRHMREGHRQGVQWKTEIPDTDPGPPGGFPEGRGR